MSYAEVQLGQMNRTLSGTQWLLWSGEEGLDLRVGRGLLGEEVWEGQTVQRQRIQKFMAWLEKSSEA